MLFVSLLFHTLDHYLCCKAWAHFFVYDCLPSSVRSISGLFPICVPPRSLCVHDWFSGGVRSSDGTLVLLFSLKGVSNSVLLVGARCLSVPPVSSVSRSLRFVSPRHMSGQSGQKKNLLNFKFQCISLRTVLTDFLCSWEVVWMC